MLLRTVIINGPLLVGHGVSVVMVAATWLCGSDCGWRRERWDATWAQVVVHVVGHAKGGRCWIMQRRFVASGRLPTGTVDRRRGEQLALSLSLL